jgi:hypothetical protein
LTGIFGQFTLRAGRERIWWSAAVPGELGGHVIEMEDADAG